MPRHYNEATEDLAAVSVTVTGVNALTVDATDVNCDTVVATTVSGSNLQLSGNIHSSDGELVVAGSGLGLLLRDGSGKYWRVTVDLAGDLTTSAV